MGPITKLPWWIAFPLSGGVTLMSVFAPDAVPDWIRVSLFWCGVGLLIVGVFAATWHHRPKGWLARNVWWRFAHRKPPPFQGEPPLNRFYPPTVTQLPAGEALFASVTLEVSPDGRMKELASQNVSSWHGRCLAVRSLDQAGQKIDLQIPGGWFIAVWFTNRVFDSLPEARVVSGDHDVHIEVCWVTAEGLFITCDRPAIATVLEVSTRSRPDEK